MTDREFVQFLNVVCVKFPNIASWFRNMADDGEGTQDAWRKTLRSNGKQDCMDAIDAIHADPPRDSRGDLIHWENYPSIVRKFANEYARRRQPGTRANLGKPENTGTLTSTAGRMLAASHRLAEERWDAGYLKRPESWQRKWNQRFRESDRLAKETFGHKEIHEYVDGIIELTSEVHRDCMNELTGTIPLDADAIASDIEQLADRQDKPF